MISMKIFIICLIPLILHASMLSGEDSSDFTSYSFSSEFGSIPSQNDGCWLNSYGRGAGQVPTHCSGSDSLDAGLCYQGCQQGYTGVGPVCWQNCPAGFADTGAYCEKPSSYGRGGGYISESDCSDNNSEGCEQWGALWYPDCAANFYNVGCCVCTPECPSDMNDNGVACEKNSYGRGAGYVPNCSDNLESDAGLCYNACQNGDTGVGPVCWGQCSSGYSQCGLLCLEHSSECTGDIVKIVAGVVEAIGDLISIEDDPVGAIEGVADVVKDFWYPICN